MDKKKEVKNKKNNKDVKKVEKRDRTSTFVQGILLPPKVVAQIADEVVKRIRSTRSPQKKISKSKIDNPLFLDTSAIIDGRMFDLMRLGLFWGNMIVLESVLSEIKGIADSKDGTKKERGRKALKNLDRAKKQKNVKIHILQSEQTTMPVDDQIVSAAKKYKGRVLTCDYNLSQKAKISGVVSIDIYELANVLKTQALPGENYWVKVVQKGKAQDQGVGYLPDGTMIVVEKGEQFIGRTIKVLVSRIIQTDAGKILFARMIQE